MFGGSCHLTPQPHQLYLGFRLPSGLNERKLEPLRHIAILMPPAALPDHGYYMTIPGKVGDFAIYPNGWQNRRHQVEALRLNANKRETLHYQFRHDDGRHSAAAGVSSLTPPAVLRVVTEQRLKYWFQLAESTNAKLLFRGEMAENQTIFLRFLCPKGVFLRILSCSDKCFTVTA